MHHQKCDKHRQWKGQRHHHRSAYVAEEQQQQDHHQDGSLQQRAAHGVDGALDQCAAVIEHLDACAPWQRRLQLGQARAYRVDHLRGVGAAQAHDQTFNRLADAVDGHCAVAGQTAVADFGQVSHAQRHAVARRHHNAAQVVQGGDRTFRAHDQCIVAIAQTAGPVVAVVALHRAGHVPEMQPRRRQPGTVRRHQEGAYLAAQCIEIGDAGNRAQRRADGPVQQRAPLGQAQAAALDGEHEHVRQGCGDRRQTTTDVAWQLAGSGCEAFGNLLAGPVDVGTLVEVEGDVGDGVLGDRAQHVRVLDAQQFHFQRHYHAGLHFLGSHAGGLQNQLDLGRGNVRVGIDG